MALLFVMKLCYAPVEALAEDSGTKTWQLPDLEEVK
jgi:hypothetical protein